MRVLLIGGGGREHALGWKLAQSSLLETLISCQGNPGLAELGDVVLDVDPTDPEAIVELCAERNIDLVVVGPEAPLAAGIADALMDAEIPVFGPTRSGARLESSKSFAKEVMAGAGVPTAASATFNDRESAVLHLKDSPGPYVVKADGLAAGKGVLVTDSIKDAIGWVDDCLGGKFGEAGSSVLIENYLDGPEVSIFYICADRAAIPLQPARDYKRLFDGDKGPNTGGMGSFSPVANLDADLVDWTTLNVVLPTLAELASRDVGYTGFLYVGLILTNDGPRVLEFNCRLGDPETEVLMPLITSDLLVMLHAAATVGIGDHSVTWSAQAAVDVVLAAPGYPESPETGLAISGLEPFSDVLVFHSGTRETDDGLVTAGGRVLNVVGLGRSVGKARERAYDAARRIDFAGTQFRSDIAADTAGGVG
ncbi:MAG: phosphoribosylamine--glycine ligase [Acidimicrobiia bacterium]